MTQTPTTDPSAHDFDKHNWDKHNWVENALGNNSEAIGEKNGTAK